MRKKRRTRKEPLHLDKVDRVSFPIVTICSCSAGRGITDLSGLCVMRSHRAGRGMHLLGASRLQTEQGLEVKWYPAQTGVCMPVGRHQGDPLSPPPCHPLPVSQKSKPIPDCPITWSPLQTRATRRVRLRVPENESALTLTEIHVSEKNARIWAAAVPAMLHPDFRAVLWDRT